MSNGLRGEEEVLKAAGIVSDKTPTDKQPEDTDEKEEQQEVIYVGRVTAQVFVALANAYISGNKVPLQPQRILEITRAYITGNQASAFLNPMEKDGLLISDRAKSRNKVRVICIERVVILRENQQVVGQVWPPQSIDLGLREEDQLFKVVAPQPKEPNVSKVDPVVSEVTTQVFPPQVEPFVLSRRLFHGYVTILQKIQIIEHNYLVSRQIKPLLISVGLNSHPASIVHELELYGLLKVVGGKKKSRKNPTRWAVVYRPVQNKEDEEIFVPSECEIFFEEYTEDTDPIEIFV